MEMEIVGLSISIGVQINMSILRRLVAANNYNYNYISTNWEPIPTLVPTAVLT